MDIQKSGLCWTILKKVAVQSNDNELLSTMAKTEMIVDEEILIQSNKMK